MNVPKGLRQRSGFWWMDFREKGRRYRKSTGVPIAHDKKDKASLIRAATSILDQARAKVVLGQWTTASLSQTKTFHEMVEKYRKHFLGELKAKSTMRSVMTQLDEAFGRYKIFEVTADLINDWKLECIGDGYSPNTINRALAYLRRIFKIAVTQWEWTNKNPALRVDMVKGAKPRDRWLTDEEEVRLLVASPPWLKDLIIFGVNTGMRLQEILNLTWPDVDFQRRVIQVIVTKTKEPRTIPINDKVIELLQVRSRVRTILTNLVFLRRGKKVHKSTVTVGMARATKKAGITNFVFHDLRHTFATRLVQKGTDLYTVQRLLGHKTGNMTQRYAHHSVDSLRSAVNIL